MKSLTLLVAAALAATTLEAAETKAPPPSAKSNAAAPRAAFEVSLRPDLKITAKPNNGIGPLFDFKIENIGNIKSKEAGIQFWAMPPCQIPNGAIGSGKLIKTGEVPALIVTTSQSYAFSYSFEMPAQYRGCAIKVVVDPEHKILEVTRTNNEVILQTKPAPAPDLVVMLVVASSGDRTILVRNTGNAAAGPSVLYARCTSAKINIHGNEVYPCDVAGNNPSKVWTWNVPSLAPFKDFTHALPVPGMSANFEFRADSNNQVLESNENNNDWPSH